MLLIKNHQISAFQEAAKADYNERIAKEVSIHILRKCKITTIEGIFDKVIANAPVAVGHEFRAQGQVLAYVFLAIHFGNEFCSILPWAAKILSSPTDPRDKLINLINQSQKEIDDYDCFSDFFRSRFK